MTRCPSASRLPKRLALGLLTLALVLPASVAAAPFVPADDQQVLERLPDRSTPQYRDLGRLRAALAAAPNEVGAATTLADAYYRISRSEGDPRFLGYAQAALAPWWGDPEAPTAVLVMRATILQSNHEFRRALLDLDRAITRNPRNARAILVRASVLAVQEKYDEARLDCARLQGLARSSTSRPVSRASMPSPVKHSRRGMHSNVRSRRCRVQHPTRAL